MLNLILSSTKHGRGADPLKVGAKRRRTKAQILASKSEAEELKERISKLEAIVVEVANERDQLRDRANFLESNAASDHPDSEEDEDKADEHMDR